jgi:hypothetical protein
MKLFEQDCEQRPKTSQGRQSSSEMAMQNLFDYKVAV